MLKEKASIAIVVFVKTPGFSSFKTRLSFDIGRENANTFYEKSLTAMESLGLSLEKTDTDFSFYWAVAEKEALEHPLWKKGKKVSQGEGGLAQRLSRVYSKLKQKYTIVVFLGADAPQLKLEDLDVSLKSFSQSEQDFLLGPAIDGGFYLFAGKKELQLQEWERVEYSSDKTFQELITVLIEKGNVEQLDSNFDVDDRKSLSDLSLLDAENLLPKQKEVILWARKILS